MGPTRLSLQHILQPLPHFVNTGRKGFQMRFLVSTFQVKPYIFIQEQNKSFVAHNKNNIKVTDH